jgi:hypothetical protein
MKKIVTLLLALICCVSVFAKDPEPKTLLVIFKSKELKDNKTTIREIESQFSSFFTTRYYSGNSELALTIEIPSTGFDERIFGEFLIQLQDGNKIQLQHLAFRLFDLTENKNLYKTYLAMYEENLTAKKKAPKTSRPSSKP